MFHEFEEISEINESIGITIIWIADREYFMYERQ